MKNPLVPITLNYNYSPRRVKLKTYIIVESIMTITKDNA